MGSEMCIRDRRGAVSSDGPVASLPSSFGPRSPHRGCGSGGGRPLGAASNPTFLKFSWNGAWRFFVAGTPRVESVYRPGCKTWEHESLPSDVWLL